MDNNKEFVTINMTNQSLKKPDQTLFSRIIKKRLVGKSPKTINSHVIPHSIHTNLDNINYYPPPRRYSNNSMIIQNNNIYINPIYTHSKKVSTENTNFNSLYNSNSLNYVEKNLNSNNNYESININESEKKFIPVRDYQYNILDNNNIYQLTENNSFYEIKQADNREIHSFYQNNNSSQKFRFKKRMSPKKIAPKCILSYRNLNTLLSNNFCSSTPSIHQNKNQNYILKRKKYVVVDDDNNDNENERKSYNYISTNYFDDYSNYSSKKIEKNHSYNNLEESDFGVSSTKCIETKGKLVNEFSNIKNKQNISNNFIEPSFYCNLDSIQRNSNFKENHSYHETNQSNKNKPYEIIKKNLTNKIKLNNNFTMKNTNKTKLSKIPKGIKANDLIKKLNISKEKLSKIKNINQSMNINDNHSYYEIKSSKKEKKERLNTISNIENKPKGLTLNEDLYVKYFPYVSKSPYKFYRKRGINGKNNNKVSCYVYTVKNDDIKNNVSNKKTHNKRYSNNVVYHEIENFKKALKKDNSAQKVVIKKKVE